MRGAGVITLAGLLWLAAGAPVGIDRWLDVTGPPMRAEAIVVLGGGSTGDNLPLPQGWERLSTAAGLFTEGFAPIVIISGGGTERVSESEVYANAGAWLGIPRSAIVFESMAQSTSDHGYALSGLTLPNGTIITTDTPLLVVRSAFHSRRALMAFTRAGFTHVRVVSHYTAKAPAPPGTPGALTNTVIGYEPSGKQYGDVLFRLAYRAFDFLSTSEKWARSCCHRAQRGADLREAD